MSSDQTIDDAVDRVNATLEKLRSARANLAALSVAAAVAENVFDQNNPGIVCDTGNKKRKNLASIEEEVCVTRR